MNNSLILVMVDGQGDDKLESGSQMPPMLVVNVKLTNFIKY